MLKEEQVQGRALNHLGLVAATIDKVGLIEIVDRAIPISKEIAAEDRF